MMAAKTRKVVTIWIIYFLLILLNWRVETVPPRTNDWDVQNISAHDA